jgi:hypothetical protein
MASGTVGQSYLFEAIEGIFDNFMNDAPPSAAEIAPMRDQNSLAVQYMAADSDAIPESQDPVQNVAVTAAFVDSVRTFSRNTETVNVKTPFRAYIPQRVVQGIESNDAAALIDGVDIVTAELERLQEKYWSAHLADTLTALATLPATSAGSGTLVLTATNAPLVQTLNAMIEEVRIATGNARDLVLYTGMPVLQRLLNQNEVFDQGGIALGSAGSADTNVRRLGAVEIGAVQQLLNTKLLRPVRLVVDDFVFKTAGVNAAQFATGMYLVQASAIPAKSALTTLTQTIDGTRGAGPFSVSMSEVGVANGLPDGTVVGVQAAWKVKKWADERGRRIATTLA